MTVSTLHQTSTSLHFSGVNKTPTRPNTTVLPPSIKRLFNTLPKTELHMHLSGSTPMPLIKTFLAEQGMDELAIRRQTKLKPVYKDLDDFLETYYAVASHVKSAEQFRRATAELVKEAARENVVYLEIRSSILSKGDDAPQDIVRAIEDGMRDGMRWAETNLNQTVTSRLIVLAQRAGKPADSLKSAQLAIALSKQPDSLIVGFDLAGSESKHPVTDHADAFQLIQAYNQTVPVDKRLGITIHAGETDASGKDSGIDSIRNAIALGADRIGHGLQIANDPTLLKEIIQKKIPVEMAPWSNVSLSNVPSYQGHPVADLLDAGASVSVSTDNRMISNISLTEQLGHLYKTGVLTCWHQFRDLTLNGAKAAFLPELAKKRVQKQVETALQQTEKTFKKTIQQFLSPDNCQHINATREH